MLHVTALRQSKRCYVHLLQSVAWPFDGDAKLTSSTLLARTAGEVIQRRKTTDAPIPHSGTDLVKPFST